jgi:hypothetical protein
MTTTTNSPIIIECLDELIHSDATPVCSDLLCPCHDEQPSDSYITQAREKALLSARKNSAAYLARIDQEVRATLTTASPQPRQRNHLKLVK